MSLKSHLQPSTLTPTSERNEICWCLSFNIFPFSRERRETGTGTWKVIDPHKHLFNEALCDLCDEIYCTTNNCTLHINKSTRREFFDMVDWIPPEKVATRPHRHVDFATMTSPHSCSCPTYIIWQVHEPLLTLWYQYTYKRSFSIPEKRKKRCNVERGEPEHTYGVSTAAESYQQHNHQL